MDLQRAASSGQGIGFRGFLLASCYAIIKGLTGILELLGVLEHHALSCYTAAVIMSFPPLHSLLLLAFEV